MVVRILLLALVLVGSGWSEPQMNRQMDCPMIQTEPMYSFTDFPDRVWVNGRKWKVNKLSEPIKMDGKDYYGMTYCPQLLQPVNWKKMFTIEVYMRQRKMEVRQTLIHELMHASSMCDDSLMTRHQFIVTTSTDLTLLFADPRNRGLVDYLSQ